MTASFLALAAGGAAACDSSPPDSPGVVVEETFTTVTEENVEEEPVEEEPVEEEPVVEESTPAPVAGAAGELFYCADADGLVVDEEYCDDDTGDYYIWHSSSYPRNAPVGTLLRGGGFFPAGDAASRRAFSLPETGRIGNGSTIKTNVVGRGTSGSSVTDGGSTSSGG
ncbi:hypothetical protein GCM10025331_18980 [Actinoplanes utahensis]|nr:hypothetical protein Aut01nite_26190 [Actinoplanes utahensis]